MGNHGSSINIVFDRMQPTVYYAGDTISGHVEFTVTERTSKIDDIYVIVTGDVGYTNSRTVRMQNGQHEKIVTHRDLRILERRVSFGRPESSPQRPCQTSGSLDILNMTNVEAGQYKYPFALRLPDSLPPTLHPEDYPFVRYELQVVIERKWFTSNNHHRQPLRIHPRVDLLQLSHSQRSLKFNTKCKEMTVKGVLQRASLAPGEQTNLAIEIINPNQSSVKQVYACLIQRYEIEECRRRLELVRVLVPDVCDNRNERIEVTCPISVPVGTAPTYTYTSRTTGTALHITVHYDIKVEVKVRGLFSDFDVLVPITIGTDPAVRSHYDDRTPASRRANASQYTDDDNVTPPPSYESVVGAKNL